MFRQDALLGVGIRVESPDVALVGAAEQHAIAPGKHVVVAEVRGVVHGGLRQEHGELPFDGGQLLVAEESMRAESGAVDDGGLAQLRDMCFRLIEAMNQEEGQIHATN